MASSAWKGFITFGLISIPVKLYPAARSSRVGLHQLHAVCKTRLRQPLYCPTCNRIVERSEVVKGYEYEDGKYVVIDPEEIKKITPESARAMEILAFVKESEIDPLFFDSSYFLVPEDQGKKAYQLLLKTMEDKDRVAIAKITMHQREYTVFLRPYDHGIALHTMYFANEIREAPGYGNTENVKLTPQEVKLADQLVDNLSEEFQLKKYHDEFETRLRALIEAKQKGREIASAPHKERAPVIDMMTALKKSLEKTSGARKSPLHSTREAAAHEKRTRRKAS
ncbi:MAG TPA: Ku protein [Candidatus Acidoferrales bacterium]|nr:Ku protein [Candidatus Acidoferrales bacterium]